MTKIERRAIPVVPPQPVRAGGERNPHGTRVRRRIECGKCGAEDYVSSGSSKSGSVLCRRCAQAELQVYEVGIHVPEPLKKWVCEECRVTFELPEKICLEEGGPALCPNCLNGFEVWRGRREMSPEDRSQMTIETRLSGTLLRKKIQGKKA